MAHRRRAYRVIGGDFRDQAFNAPMLAAARGLSERYVQQVFAAKGGTASAANRNRRIAEACSLSRRQGEAWDTVAAVVYACGFAEPACFSPVFRQQTGLSPVGWASRPHRSGPTPDDRP